jgi:hypothetical protein
MLLGGPWLRALTFIKAVMFLLDEKAKSNKLDLGSIS